MRNPVLFLLLMAGLASAEPGVPVRSGDRVTSRITSTEDVDAFLVEGTAGGSLTAAATAGALRVFGPGGGEIDPGEALTAPGSLRNLPLPGTGTYRVEVDAGGGAPTAFDLSLKVKHGKGARYDDQGLAAGERADFAFPGGEGATVSLGVKYTVPGSEVTVVGIYDPEGVPHPELAALLVASAKGAKGKFVLPAPFGEWRLRLEGVAFGSGFAVSARVKMPKAGKRTLALPNAEIIGAGDVSGTKVPLTIRVFDPESRAQAVLVEYSLDDGATWHAAADLAGSTEPVAATATPGGAETAFEWGTLAQLGYGYAASVRIRATPVAPKGDGDEWRDVLPPFEVWRYPEPATGDLHADIVADLAADGSLDGFVLLDARPQADYDAYHLPGALFWEGQASLPADKDRRVVLYCHGFG